MTSSVAGLESLVWDGYCRWRFVGGSSCLSVAEVTGMSLHSDKEKGSDSKRSTSRRGQGVEAKNVDSGAILPGWGTSSVTDHWSDYGQITVLSGLLFIPPEDGEQWYSPHQVVANSQWISMCQDLEECPALAHLQ